MTRIIAGAARGRRLDVPQTGTRPTTDRVREAVFSALEHRLGGWQGTTVLDLYAGSGAMGLEAASRGAAQVMLVERDPRAVAVVKRNVELVGVPDVRVVKADVTRMAQRSIVDDGLARVNLVILDPPYAVAAEVVAEVLQRLREGQWLAGRAMALVERSARDEPFRWPHGWEELSDRRYSETRILLGCLVASGTSD